MKEYKHFKLPSRDPWYKWQGLRLVDFLIFAVLALILFWLLILSSELGDVEKTVRQIQSEERP